MLHAVKINAAPYVEHRQLQNDKYASRLRDMITSYTNCGEIYNWIKMATVIFEEICSNAHDDVMQLCSWGNVVIDFHSDPFLACAVIFPVHILQSQALVVLVKMHVSALYLTDVMEVWLLLFW